MSLRNQKWQHVSRYRWVRGPLRVMRGFYGGRLYYYPAVMRGNKAERVGEANYSTPQKAMAAADTWAKSIASLLVAMEASGDSI